MKQSWIIVLVVIVVLLGGYLWYAGQSGSTGEATEPADSMQPADDSAAPAADDSGGMSTESTAPAADDGAGMSTESTAPAATDTGTATDTATGSADSMAAAAPEGLAALLTPDSFDAAKISALIDGSDLGDAQKTALKTAVTQAEGNPAMVQAVIDQVKAAFGL
jgi:cytoskeletal protein RodZ